VKTILFYFISWILFGCAFWIFVLSIVGWGHVNFFIAACSYAVAYMVGFLAIITPSGIGVREGILVWLLMHDVPSGVGVIIAAVSRLIGTFIEIICVVSVFIKKGFLYGKKSTAEKI
jgi:uncharacterized membrane protein YbhN (UPF0104 family)